MFHLLPILVVILVVMPVVILVVMLVVMPVVILVVIQVVVPCFLQVRLPISKFVLIRTGTPNLI